MSDETTDDAPPTVRVDSELRNSEADRYETLDLLGRGGMGEVNLCRDRHIGRQVAIKTELSAASGWRFLREALIQGQLEHPSVVPVYDVGIKPDGAAFFVMKRVRGSSLREVLDQAARGETTHGRHKLLSTLAQACLAVDFAHAHGVVHRDLKPANLMLGVWGEVYVLDWGVAKVSGAPDPIVVPPVEDARIADSGETAVGAAIGTLGYMAPEQLEGTATAATDVYALGTMLFEVLALERLHKGTAEDRIRTTALGEHGLRERLQARATAPELVEICARATALSPRDRYTSARAFHEALEGYLAGDRDLELRRTLAKKHAERAAELGATHRSDALRELGRALALDPTQREAIDMLRALLTSVPDALPEEVTREIRQIEMASRTRAAHAGRRSIPGLFFIALTFVVMDVRDWMVFGAYVLSLVVYAARAAQNTYAKKLLTDGDYKLAYAILMMGAALVSRTFGSLILTPALVASISAAFVIHIRARERVTFVLPVALATLVGPLVLEALGVLAPSYQLRDGAIVIEPHMVAFSWLAVPALTVLVLAAVVVPIAVLGGTGDALRDARSRMAFQTWQLRQLVPEEGTS